MCGVRHLTVGNDGILQHVEGSNRWVTKVLIRYCWKLGLVGRHVIGPYKRVPFGCSRGLTEKSKRVIHLTKSGQPRQRATCTSTTTLPYRPKQTSRSRLDQRAIDRLVLTHLDLPDLPFGPTRRWTKGGTPVRFSPVRIGSKAQQSEAAEPRRQKI